jgi:DNA-binding transcriptional LysR family regulator
MAGQSANFSSAAVFVRVVEAGSIRGAARALGMPKSNVSRRVAELEAQLGARLLQRTTRRLRLTDAGQAYYRGATVAVATLLDAERAAHALQVAPRGVLRVTGPAQLGAQYLWPIVRDYMRSYPEVEVSLHLTDRIVDIVEEGFDVAIRAGPLRDTSLVARRIASTSFVVAASPAYVSVHGRPRRPEDLVHHRCLTHADALTETWRFRRAGKPVDVQVAGPLACTSFQLLRDACIDGVGVARVPSVIAGDALAAGTLVRVLERFEPPESPLHVLYPSQRHMAPKVRTFVDALVRAFSDPPWLRAA